MSLTGEGLTILVVLLPGFISSLILSALVSRRTPDQFGRIIEALVFSFTIYAVVSMWIGQSAVLLIRQDLEAGAQWSVRFNPVVVWPILGLAVVLPLIMGLCFASGIHMRILRRLRVTKATGYGNAWLGALMSERRYVILDLRDGRRLFGWPLYFSDDPDDGMLYLYQPSWVLEGGRYQDLGMHGIFLNRRDIAFIEFTMIDERAAHSASPDGGETDA